MDIVSLSFSSTASLGQLSLNLAGRICCLLCQITERMRNIGSGKVVQTSHDALMQFHLDLLFFVASDSVFMARFHWSGDLFLLVLQIFICCVLYRFFFGGVTPDVRPANDVVPFQLALRPCASFFLFNLALQLLHKAVDVYLLASEQDIVDVFYQENFSFNTIGLYIFNQPKFCNA